MKKCKKCNEEKQEQDFYHNHDECKKCWLAYCSERNKKPENREKKRLSLKAWREANPEKQKGYVKKYRDKINARQRTPKYRKMILDGVKKWRKENPEKYSEILKKRDKTKLAARLKVMNEIRRGRMTRPTMCPKCNLQTKCQAHHKDYSKPLEVLWMCFKCHQREHGKLLE